MRTIQNNAIKLSQAASRVRWFKTDEANISRTISVLVLRELKWPGIQSVSYIYIYIYKYIYTCLDLVLMAACQPVGTGGWSKLLFLPGPAF
jgi:hypothetical protein